MPQNDIQYLTNKEIDKTLWNACIDKASNGLIYAYSFYLDAMTDNWDALILGNYEAVMPLPWRKKWGIRYLYPPAFTQQLGIFSQTKFNFNAMFGHISKSVRYGDIFFNYGNTFVKESACISEKTNFIIDLSKGYERIAFNYKKDLISNLKKAKKEKLNFSAESNIDFAISLYHDNYKNRLSHLKPEDFENFKKLCVLLKHKDMCFIRKVTDEKSVLLSIGLFLKDSRRIYNLMNTTTNAGRNKEANHFLLNAVIEEFAGQKLIFDFEGSDLPGIQNFYKNFGGEDQTYFYFHHNQLPLILKLFKK